MILAIGEVFDLAEDNEVKFDRNVLLTGIIQGWIRGSKEVVLLTISAEYVRSYRNNQTIDVPARKV